MPISRDRSPKSSSIFPVIGILLLLAGCSSPKAAAVPAAKPGLAVVAAAGRPNPAHSDPGVQSDPFIATVRAGTMSGYSQATIGQAFEAAFSNAHWSSQQPKSGVRVVTFTGLLPRNMRRDCGAPKATFGAVVAGLHVPDNCVVAGVPARIVRKHVAGEGWVTVPRAE